MLAEGLVAVAAAGGTAVVQAAGTDLWASVRPRVAKLLGRNDPERERAELERLDQTASTLAAVDPTQATSVWARQEASWQTRFELLLENLHDDERERHAHELRAIIDLARQKQAEGVSGNVFHGPTAFQIGDHNHQDNRFG